MNVIKKILTNILIYGTEFIVIMLSVFPIVWVALSSFKRMHRFWRDHLHCQQVSQQQKRHTHICSRNMISLVILAIR